LKFIYVVFYFLVALVGGCFQHVPPGAKSAYDGKIALKDTKKKVIINAFCDFFNK
jgi:hypothetical protein